MRFAYADPPYLGSAVKAYGPVAAEFDTIDGHAHLIARLEAEFDGWALSANTPSLRTILGLCPEDCRVLAWVKPWAWFKPGVGLAYAWEPIILRGGRRLGRGRTVRDYLSANAVGGKGLPGAKPEALAFWIFEAAGLEPGDEFVDVFPGTGVVARAWAEWGRYRDGLLAGGVTAKRDSEPS